MEKRIRNINRDLFFDFIPYSATTLIVNAPKILIGYFKVYSVEWTNCSFIKFTTFGVIAKPSAYQKSKR